ncbi:MAG TPA: universal stress protein [Terriglobales bacterium]|nr:universal stress protein [Terriglobales bacterium]
MPTAQATLRLTFKNVLLPTDFTDASERALAYARAFAEDYDVKIYVSYAVNATPPIFIPMEPIPLDLDAEWQDAQQQLGKFLSNDLLQDTRHEGILARGETWNVIEDVIHRHSIDLVILGTRGKHGLKKFVLGSGAEQIFRHADCPVLTVGPRVEPRSDDIAAFRHIVFATDFSAGSLHALPYALSLAEENQAGLSFLHVMPMVIPQQQGEVGELIRKRLEALIPPEASDWCHPTPVVSFEFPAEGILHIAEEQRADLIVMGVHKRAPNASSHLPWAIAYEVICHAHCPVLTVRG